MHKAPKKLQFLNDYRRFQNLQNTLQTDSNESEKYAKFPLRFNLFFYQQDGKISVKSVTSQEIAPLIRTVFLNSGDYRFYIME